MGVIRRAVWLLNKTPTKLVVVFLWLALAGIGGWLTPKFLGATSDGMSVPDTAPSVLAEKAMRKYFPSDVSGSIVVYVSNTTHGVLGAQLERFSFSLQKAAQNSTFGSLMSFEGYYFALAQNMSDTAEGFVSSNNRSTIIVVTFHLIGTDTGTKIVQQLLDGLMPTVSGVFSVTLLGEDAFMDIIQSSVEHDMAIGDGVALPISLLIFAFTMFNLRMVLLPLLCVAVSGLTAYGLMYFFALVTPVMSATMSLMMSLVIAFNIDYALFLGTRFLEECESTPPHVHPDYEVVTRTLETAGHTCFVSGLTLAAAFFGICIIPQSTLRGLGLGAGVSVVMTLLTSLSLLPAMLLIFPNFFSGRIGKCTPKWLERFHFQSSNDVAVMKQSCWYRLGHRATRFPHNVLIIGGIVLALVPFAVFSFGFPLSNSVVLALPQGNAVTKAFAEMNENFGYGYLSPFTVLIVPNLNGTVPPNGYFLSNAFVATATKVLDAFSALPHTSCADAVTYFSAACNSIPLPFIRLCLGMPNASDVCPEIVSLYNSHVSKEAVTVTVQLRFDPSGPMGQRYYSEALALVKNLSSTLPQVSLFFGGGGGWDGVFVSYDYFPLMIGLTVAAVLVFVGLAFRSVMIPLRAAVTIACTLFFVFGLSVFVYVYGAFAWTTFWGFASQGAILWMPPLVSFSICAGLCLDYDLFLLVRIREFYLEGYDTQEAIALGMYKTGRIVTSAGVIMAIAFAGLLFSNTPAMNVLSFYLFFNVLFDTFIIRIFLVPALFSIAADANWWPGTKCEKRLQLPTSLQEEKAPEDAPLLK